MTCEHCKQIDRRAFLGLLALGAASVLAGCGTERHPISGPPPAMPTWSHPSVTTTTEAPTTTSTTTTPPATAALTAPEVIWHGPPAAIAARQVAITIDDGYCNECAQAYVELAQATGIHITFNPNGCYEEIWNPLAEILKPLVESGQVQIGNHTYNHPNLTRLSDANIRAQLEKNDEWIGATYGVGARPWWRPPYGYHDARTDEIAFSVGYTNVLMWNGTYGDATPLSAQELLANAQQYLQPGVVMLGHANHPTATHLFPQIAEIIASRDLHPVTLDEMFGTRRPVGQPA